MDVYRRDHIVLGRALAPIAVVTGNGPCFRGALYARAFDGEDPLLRHVRTRSRPDGNSLAVEVNRFRQI